MGIYLEIMLEISTISFSLPDAQDFLGLPTGKVGSGGLEPPRTFAGVRLR